jgi:hypothetical protein
MADTRTEQSEPKGRPKLLKGALAIYPESGGDPALVVFQYNPDQVKRTFSARTPPRSGSGGNQGAQKEDVLRVFGPPVESIQLSIALSATDEFNVEKNKGQDLADGVHCALAKLELLMYPKTTAVEAAKNKAAKGQVQVAQASVPLVLLVWGKSRVVPVMITSFSVSEDAFDPQLNPLEAKVDLGLRVLTYVEFPPKSKGIDAFKAYHGAKENLAAQYQHGFDEKPIRSLLPPLGKR